LGRTRKQQMETKRRRVSDDGLQGSKQKPQEQQPIRVKETLERTYRLEETVPSQLKDTSPDYLEDLDFDPLRAEGFELFEMESEMRVAPHFRPGDSFQLNEDEKEMFARQGFVGTPRLASSSMGQTYYKIYNNDLPVFITLDSMLHAWAYSFDRLMAQVEKEAVKGKLRKTLVSMYNALKKEDRETSIFNKNIKLGVDVWLTVAINLLDSPARSYHANVFFPPGKETVPLSTALGDDAAEVMAKQYYDGAVSGSGMGVVELFGEGSKKNVSWQDFVPRGHYAKSENRELQGYFRACKWMSFPLGLASDDEVKNKKLLPQFAGALLLCHLVELSGTQSSWDWLWEWQESLAGATDGVRLNDIQQLLHKWNYTGDLLRSLDSQSKLESVQASIEVSRLGAEVLNSERGESEFADPNDEPTVYVMEVFGGGSLGVDHWSYSKLVGRVHGEDNLIRRTVSAVDAAFTALGSAAAGEVLYERITSPVIPDPPEEEGVFSGYDDHPAVVPSEERGAKVGTITFTDSRTVRYNDPTHKPVQVSVDIHENDTVATIKHVLWPQSHGALSDKEDDRTPLSISASWEENFICLQDTTDHLLFSKAVPRLDLIMKVGDAIKWRFTNVFKHKSPEGMPRFIHPSEGYVALRDGMPIQSQLLAAKTAIDSLPQPAWDVSVYSLWIKTLRSIGQDYSSDSTIFDQLPQAMRTKAFASRMLGTQLASYAELQHAFALYIKRMVLRGGCEYPFGLVEPSTAWEPFCEMVSKFASVVAPLKLHSGPGYQTPDRDANKYLKHFIQSLQNLQEISYAQLRCVPLSTKQENFIKEMLETLEYGSGPPRFEGLLFVVAICCALPN